LLAVGRSLCDLKPHCEPSVVEKVESETRRPIVRTDMSFRVSRFASI